MKAKSKPNKYQQKYVGRIGIEEIGAILYGKEYGTDECVQILRVDLKELKDAIARKEKRFEKIPEDKRHNGRLENICFDIRFAGLSDGTDSKPIGTMHSVVLMSE